jgi:hypothetical protein
LFDRDLTVLDGADVSGRTAKECVLPEIEDHGFTRIQAANPGIEPARLMFELYGPDGKLKAEAAERTLGPSGSLSEGISELFPAAGAVGEDYVRIVSDRGVVLFEELGQARQYIKGLNGQDPADGATVLYSPQYVVGGSDWGTAVTVINLDDRAGLVTLRFIGEDGSQIGEAKQRAVAARGKVRISDQNFFLDAGNQTLQGYVVIESDGVRLAGSVVFGDPGRSRFSSALPLVRELGRDLVFGQLASNDVYFTGLAIVNPNDGAVNAEVSVYDAAGQLLASKTERVEGRCRRSGVLTQWFPELIGLNRGSGYIRVKADGGVASFALFGTQALTALSAVPAQSVQ